MRYHLPLLLLAIILSASGCQLFNFELTEQRKAELRAQFYNPNYIVKDTLIHYQVYSDSLVFEFKPKAHYEYWSTQTWLKHHGVNSIDLGVNDMHPVINNKLIFTGFHIPPDSIQYYKAESFSFPHLGDSLLVLKRPHSNIRLNLWDLYDENTLQPINPKYGNNYVSFNLQLFRILNEKDIKYCLQIMR